MVEKIFINLNAGSIASARIQGESDSSPVPFSPLVVGDIREFDIYLVDGEGNFESSGDVAGLQVKIGKPGLVLSEVNNFLPVPNGFRVSISLATQAIANFPPGDAVFEVTRLNYRGESRTILQAPITLTGEVSEILVNPPQLFPETFILSVTSENGLITTGSGKIKFRTPFNFVPLEVRGSVTEASSGSSIICTIKADGVSILSNHLEIPSGSKTSQDALTLPIISAGTISDDAEISIDVDQVGSSTPGRGLKVLIAGRRG